MDIEFVSGENHLMVADPLLGVKEFDNVEYMGTVRPDGGNYKLVLTARGEVIDEYREILKEEFTLIFEGTLSNIVELTVMDGTERVGRFYFSYYPDTTHKTFQVCLELRKWKGQMLDISFVFRRLRNFTFNHG